MKSLLNLFILIPILSSSLNANAQDSKANSAIILFIDEPLPLAAQKISSKKIQTVSDYVDFQKKIKKNLGKVGGNLAKLDTYETPTPNHGHRATVSFYSVNNFDSVERSVLHRRDSLEQLLNSTKGDSVTLNFIRFKLSSKFPIEVLVNSQFIAKMTQLSTAHIELSAKKSVTISGKGGVIVPNSMTFTLTTGRTYYIECSFMGSGGPFVTPIFSILPEYPGRFMYSFIENNKEK